MQLCLKFLLKRALLLNLKKNRKKKKCYEIASTKSWTLCRGRIMRVPFRWHSKNNSIYYNWEIFWLRNSFITRKNTANWANQSMSQSIENNSSSTFYHCKMRWITKFSECIFIVTQNSGITDREIILECFWGENKLWSSTF